MMRELWKKLQAILRSPSATNGKSDVLNPGEILKAGYHDLRRLAEQIRAHAERAPYPHMAGRLRQIALEKQKSAIVLKEKSLGLGCELEEHSPIIKSGKNHWERMAQDLEDHKALENSFLEQAVRLAEKTPEISALLREVVGAQRPHKEALLDLVARADPQADQS